VPDDEDPLRIPIERELDLHAFAPPDIPSVVDEYLHEAHAAGFREVRLVHGRGRGVQRAIVQQTLERHALVVKFFDDSSSHLGATIAILGQDAAEVQSKESTEKDE
jgi:dsDNA-specific endonuclease/ATPase MutS2